MNKSSLLTELKRALDILPDGPSNIKQFVASLRNPEGETISRANVYQVCNGTLNLDWLEQEIQNKIAEAREMFPEYYKKIDAQAKNQK